MVPFSLLLYACFRQDFLLPLLVYFQALHLIHPEALVPVLS